MKILVSGAAVALVVGLALSGAAQAGQERWVVRSGVAHVSPQDSSGDVAGFPGNGVAVESATGLGISLSYMLSPNLGLEVLGAFPFKHKIHATGPDLSGLGHIANTQHLPPTVLINYALPLGENFRPYAGVGINHTIFFKERATDNLEAALGPSEVSLDASTGWAVQAGFDWDINKHEFFNLALWYIDIASTATIDFDGGPASGGAAGQTAVDVEVNPFVLMLGFGHRF